MKVLLDTQVWLWMNADPARLGKPVRALIDDASTTLYLSAASAWEIAIKYGIGKLRLPVPPSEYVPDRMRRTGVLELAVGHVHALQVSLLPRLHRDPFDRLLIAQALVLDIPIVTADRVFDEYGGKVMPAT